MHYYAIDRCIVIIFGDADMCIEEWNRWGGGILLSDSAFLQHGLHKCFFEYLSTSYPKDILRYSCLRWSGVV